MDESEFNKLDTEGDRVASNILTTTVNNDIH